MAKHLVYPYSALRDYATRVFISCGVCQEEAVMAAQIVLAANLRGVSSHGIIRLFTYYVDNLRNKTMANKTKITIIQETVATLALDGGNGLGQIIGHKAMEMCIAKARQTGIAFATTRNSNHYGIAGYYAMLALPHNMIGISLTNSQPLVAPTYGRKAIIGTNPIAVAIPSGKERPFVLDMATSVVPIGRISVYEKANEEIPMGWGIDADGKMTSNATSVRQGGALLPLGGSDILRGYKGYGLAVLVDILSGVLSGASFGSQVGKKTLEKPNANVGHFFGAINIEAFRPLDDFFADMESLIKEIKESPKAIGQERIYIHGEKEFERAERYENEGIPLLAEVVESLDRSGSEIGIPFNLDPSEKLIFRCSSSRSAMLRWLALSIILLTACQPNVTNYPVAPLSTWTYQSLRMMDEVDPNLEPDLDLIALYTRTLNQEYQIRLDFLDLDDEFDATILIALDLRPGGNAPLSQSPTSDLNWDILIVIPNKEPAYVINDFSISLPGINPKIDVDIELDTIVIRLPLRDISGDPARYSLQAQVLCPGQVKNICDQSPISHPGDLKPQQAQASFVFWDILPTNTPKQLLRRWNGAHTGPFGQRHGLSHLLEGASNYQIPLALIGLNSQETQAGLSRLSQNEWTDDLLSTKIIYDPGVLQNSAVNLDISEEDQMDRNGITQKTKAALVNNTLIGIGQKSPITLGGALPASGWGDSSLANKSFRYISEHPWVKIVSPYHANLDLPLINQGDHNRNPFRYLPEILYWLQTQVSQSTCDLPIINKCLLSNKSFFVIIDTTTGYPSVILNQTTDGLLQWIANPEELANKEFLSTVSDGPLNAKDITLNQIYLGDPDQNNFVRYQLDDNTLSIWADFISSKKISFLFSPISSPINKNLTTLQWNMIDQDHTTLSLLLAFPDCKLIINSDIALSVYDPNRANLLLLAPEDPDYAYPLDFSVPFDSLLIETQESNLVNIDFILHCPNVEP